MKDKLQEIREALSRLLQQRMDALNDIRVNILGKKGELATILKSMKMYSGDRPRLVGW